MTRSPTMHHKWFEDHIVIQWSRDLFKPMWNSVRNHNDIAFRYRACLSIENGCAPDFARGNGFRIDDSPSGYERSRSFEHINNVGVLGMNFCHAVGIAMAGVNHVIAFVDENISFFKSLRHAVCLKEGDLRR